MILTEVLGAPHTRTNTPRMDEQRIVEETCEESEECPEEKEDFSNDDETTTDSSGDDSDSDTDSQISSISDILQVAIDPASRSWVSCLKITVFLVL